MLTTAYSLEIEAVVNYLITSIDNDVNFAAFPFGTDTQFGNMNVSWKAVMYSDCVKTTT